MEKEVVMSIRSFVGAALIAGLVGFSSVSAHAQNAVDEPYTIPIRAYLESNVKLWLSDPIIIDSINKQNKKTSGLLQSEITMLDKKWRLKARHDNHPLVNAILSNDLSRFLAKKQDESDNLLLEIFVMDARGLNVGQSRITSDYWQGDEAKWINTFLKGPGAVFIDDVDIDESTLTFQSQASLSITDPKTGKVIGAITLGFNFEKL